MSKLDESEIIKIFQKRLGNKNSEDVEVFSSSKQNIIAKTDTLVQSTDIPPKMKLDKAARKSVVACVSDFAAKGVKPRYGIISVNFPSNISRSKVEEAASGFRRACDEFGISILGGDTNAGKEVVFNVCLFGDVEKIVPRNGSKNRDLIFATGPFGYTGAGLSILLHKKKKKKGNRDFVAKCIKSVIHPKPRVDFGVKNRKYFTSSMDSSDGLSTTLNEMASQSKRKFVINNSPHTKDLEEFAKSNQDNLVFHGGEEYEFVFTINPRHKKTILKNAKLLKTPIIQIGYVTTGKGVVLQRDGKEIPLKDHGWKHFG